LSDIVTIVGFIQSLFGILIFITKRPKHLSFTLLTIWMAVIAIYMGAGLLPFQVVEYFKPGIFPIMFLMGPLLYLYVSSLTIEDFKLKPIQLLHLIPLFIVSFHRSIIDAVPIGSTSDLSENPNYLYNKLYYTVLIISVFVYWFFGLRLILKHRKNVPLYFSNYSHKNTLTWLIFVLSLFLVLIVASFTIFYIENVLGFGIIKYSTLSFNLTVFTFVMIYFGMNQSAIYSKIPIQYENKRKTENSIDPGAKYIGSALSNEQIEDLSKTIIDYLKEDKPYLNPDYNLEMMADDLNISKHKLSQIINSGQQKNFYKFINEFRVKEVKGRLSDPAYQHYSILGIAMDCGFNSKTSFNRIFKEETGQTPTEFMRAV